MSLWVTLSLLVTIIIIFVDQTRASPAWPGKTEVANVIDGYRNQAMLLRLKRDPVAIYPHRAMMFTGFYRPPRRATGSQATGVFAQGNAVSGGAYLGDNQPYYLQRGPEPVDEAELTSAEAEAAPIPQQPPAYNNDQGYFGIADKGITEQEQTETDADEKPNYSTEPTGVEDTQGTQTSISRPTDKQSPKKNKKTTIQVDDEEDGEPGDEDEDEDDNDEQASSPFVPFKPTRRGNMPNLNNFFPMVFSFPKSFARSGSAGSPPGMITAIANSYSTGKGGVASSVATAYGGSPNGKKRRQSTNQE